MVKSKNHSNKNQSAKAHKNGIKAPKNWRRKVRSLRARGMKGMDPVFKRNQKYANKGTKLKLRKDAQRIRDKAANKVTDNAPK